jgi:hypothetical protein
MEETVEEIAEKLYPVNNTGSMFMANREQSNNALRQEGFIKGYNLDKERMYSKEDIYSLLDFIRNNAVETDEGWQINKIVYTNEELFEYFKNK